MSEKEILRRKQIIAALLAVKRIGRKTALKILKAQSRLEFSWTEFWSHSHSQLREQLLNPAQQASLREFQKKWTPESYFGWIEEQNIAIVSYEDKYYPKILKNIDDKPLIIFTKGDIFPIKHDQIAVVGTRHISGYGREVIEHLIPQLVAYDCGIVSGFMYGVDVTAQKVALDVGGSTIGVLGYGFDHLYPRSQQQLFEEFLEKGQGFITEYPPWVRPHKGNFPERNRIVAGMSIATVVIEATQRSGSHITAELAAEYGRAVCAVPGSIFSPYSDGTRMLHNLGAKMVVSAQDILEEAGVIRPSLWHFQKQSKAQLTFQDELQRQVYQTIMEEAVSADQLSERLRQDIAMVNQALSMLELGGYIVQNDFVWHPNRV